MGILSSLFPPSTGPQEAYEAASRHEALILDVREPREWRAGHAPGSKNLPLSRLQARAGELSRERRYVAVCHTGARSRVATARLRSAGLEVVNLKGGMAAWRRAGLPLEPRNGRIA